MSDFARYDEIKDQVVKLLDPKTEDSLVEFSLNKVIQDVANYCNIPVEELPLELDPTITAMCLQLIQSRSWTQGDTVNSLSEGDVSVNFGSPAEVYAQVQQLNPINEDFRVQLNQFRRLKQ